MKRLLVSKRLRVTMFFVVVMILSIMTQPLEAAANQHQKVKLKDRYGQYYGLDVNSNLNLNQGSNIDENGVLAKIPETGIEDSQYPDAWEVVDKRTENSRTYLLPDGSFVEEVYLEPIFRDNNGKLEEIDNTLINSNTRTKPMITNINGIYDFSIIDEVMTISKDNHTMTITSNSDLSNSLVKDNVILYSEIYQNIDMEYRLQTDSISHQFYINGQVDTDKIRYTINHTGLKLNEYKEYLEFTDSTGTSVFRYVKPRLTDGNGLELNTIFSYTKNSNSIDIIIELDNSVVNSKDRIYPLKLRGQLSDTEKDISVSSSYIRQYQPDTTSLYYDLYVGNENQNWSINVNMGATRTYLHVGDLGLESNQKIMSATLHLYKKRASDYQWNTIEISKTNGYINPNNVTWNNRPTSGLTLVSTTTIGNMPGWQEFDVTNYIKDIYEGKNNTIELKATNESNLYHANVFYGESGETVPKISIRYRDDFDVAPDLEINMFDYEMRVFAIKDQGFNSISFDGIAKPNSEVIFELHEKESNEYIHNETSIGNSDKYFIDPIYITSPIFNTQV